MSRTTFIGANWKMNPPPAGALDKSGPYLSTEVIEVVVFPSFLHLPACKQSGFITVGAQFGRPEDCGAFTGDVSIPMAKMAGATHILCGHSERRRNHGENDGFIAAQVTCALKHGLTAILCIGESADEQELKTTEEVLTRQLSTVLSGCKELMNAKNFIIAYEPAWAIGSGKTPVPADAQLVHALIRSLLPDQNIRIIYGGSVNGKNAKEFFAQPDIDGALVGGCSLKPDEFKAIVAAA